jgi:hypothetical protein
VIIQSVNFEVPENHRLQKMDVVTVMATKTNDRLVPIHVRGGKVSMSH